MRSIVRLVISLALLAASTSATPLGKECSSNSDCSDGAFCVAGDSVSSVQRCVAGTPCGGSIQGACPGDETSGQLACIWRPDPKTCSSNPDGCAKIDGQSGIYKCISMDRCDEYLDNQCSKSCNVNGKQCNGRGTCLLSDKGTAAKPAFQCECNSGWNGTLCDNVVDDSCVVDAGQCGEHGKCVKSSCVCSNGYKGDQCQIAPKNSSSSSSSSSGSGGLTPTITTKSPVSSSSNKTTTPNTAASKANSNGDTITTTKKKSSGPSALVIIMAVLVALIVVGAIAFVLIARKRRREQEAAAAHDYNRTDSVTNPDAARPPTPKQKIVIM